MAFDSEPLDAAHDAPAPAGATIKSAPLFQPVRSPKVLGYVTGGVLTPTDFNPEVSTPRRRAAPGSTPTMSEDELLRVRRRKRSNRTERPEVSIGRMVKALKNRAGALDTRGFTLTDAKVLAAKITQLYGTAAVEAMQTALNARERLKRESDLPADITKTLERVSRARAADLKHLVACFGIASDKLLLLNDRPTQVHEHFLREVSPELQALARRLLALEGGA